MAGAQPITAGMNAAGRGGASASGVRRGLRLLAGVAVSGLLAWLWVSRHGGLPFALPSISPLWLAVALVAAAALAAAAVVVRRRPSAPDVAAEPSAVPAAKIAKVTAGRVVGPAPESAPAESAAPALAGMDQEDAVPTRRAIEPAARSEEEPGDPLLGEIGIEQAVEKIVAGGVTRAIFVSPEGDEGAAVAVLVAREMADAGLRVLAVDLTGSGALSMPMLDSVSLPGVTDLLAGGAQFTEAVHQDDFSDCQVMPVGSVEPEVAMRAVHRLPAILDALAEAYDVIVVECGAVDASGLSRLVGKSTEIFVSVVEPDELVAEAADALVSGGYDRLTLVTPRGFLPG